MRIIWYKPHQPPDVYQPRYFPVALSRAEDTLYLPTLDPVQAIEEAVDQLFQDEMISLDEFNEVLSQLYTHRLPGEPLRETTSYKVPVQLAQFDEAPGLHPFSVRLRPGTCSAQVREIRWLRRPDEPDTEEGRTLGVWLWIAGYLEADLIDVEVEETYLADSTGNVIARLAERPAPYRREDLDDLLILDEGLADEPHEARFALTLVFEDPPQRDLPPSAPADVLVITLTPLRVRPETAAWDFGDAPPVFPLIKNAGQTAVLVEGIRSGSLSPEAERRVLDERNDIVTPDPGPYFQEHPVLLISARLPVRGKEDEDGLTDWHSPVDLLDRCPLAVTLEAQDGTEIAPQTTTIQVQSSHAEELEASYHFPQLQELPPLRKLRVEVLNVVEV